MELFGGVNGDKIYEVNQDGLIFSNNKERLDFSFIQKNLSKTYWAKGISEERLKKSIQHALCYGLYRGKQQIGFARVITDFSQEAMLSDVFIDPSFQQQGFGKYLVAMVLNSPVTKDCFRWLLLTKDAHRFYQAFGFNNSELAMFRLAEPND